MQLNLKKHMPYLKEPVTQEGKRYLGATLGTRTFTENFVSEKYSNGQKRLKCSLPSQLVNLIPPLCCYTHELSSKWTFLCRMIPIISELFRPLEEAIRYKFIPALTGQSAFNDVERILLALPSHVGGLGIINPVTSSDLQHLTSKNISAPLTSLILHRSITYPISCQESQRDCKLRAIKHKKELEQSRVLDLINKLTISYQRAPVKKGSALCWLASLPLSEESGYALHKGAFRDALCLRYGWPPSLLPSHCVCGHNVTVEHAMITSCPDGGFPSIRHNEIKDLTAKVLTETCHNVGTEPQL